MAFIIAMIFFIIKVSFQEGGGLLTVDGAEVLGVDLLEHLPVVQGVDVLAQLLLDVGGIFHQFVGLVDLHSVHHSDQILHNLSLLFIFEKIVYRNVDKCRV